ncbi:MAG: hypothetical protein WC732_05500 [Candidatus Omnitrophota bacterium]
MIKAVIVLVCLIFCGCARPHADFSAPASATVEPRPRDTGSAGWKNIPEGSRVKVVFRDGDVVEGTLVEQGYDYVRVDSDGVPLTYLKDLIWKMNMTGGADVSGK